MQKSLLESIYKKYPKAEVHFLIYREFQAVQPFLPEVKKFHFFERQEWSRWVNQVEVPLLKPVKFLGKLVDELNAEQFDIVWNWTHQKGSGYLMELIKAPTKVGLQTIKGQFNLGNSSDLKTFNNDFLNLDNKGPHYLIHMAKIFNLEKPSPYPTRNSLNAKKENLICVQPLTSDIKKNWRLHLFREWMKLHQARRPQDQIIILGSPAERDLLEEEFPLNSIKILNLQDVKNVLTHADLLISTDTAIKHLAAIQGTQILELSFGSAQPAKTAAWVDEYNCVIPKVQCWPCSHSRFCTQISHMCSEELSADDLNNIVMSLIQKQPHHKLQKHKNDFYLTLTSSGGTHVERN
ncbi:MAG: glycosyltransferase family 9 protein [Bdellovibrionota bacterium]